MTEQTPDTESEVDGEAVTRLAEHIIREVGVHYHTRPANSAARYEALNALALVAGEIIAGFDDDLGQLFFEVCLDGQIRDRRTAGLGPDDPSGGPPGGPGGAA
jgi:hypothetical protein